ncbi:MULTISPECIES: COG3014 family protein [Olivibacter]|uniref:COG3014 family protein n=2 Tax=Sphingobacteriaceae TaxID=84566 RepID=A0ABV6HKH6_9SPHI|nr:MULTISPECIES: hypothetical protein [Olivibacter]MCL4641338.1 hypothetical protein [Olivibacter sp. UJ_SKK_5.1]MDM8175386.1 hypothetical protein [Olivibacter sp. 47]MDX3914000.1 hypothetical protein [Pseudosphingobacterium sp.]QEL02147.1 hypothetical protein FKG96_15475 [Olivibacter sp. LS-1]
MKKYSKQIPISLMGLFLMVFVYGCASYNERVASYYKKIAEGDYLAAEKDLERNSLLKKPRNKLLYLMELGRVSQLNGNYEASNRYFNEADRLLEIGLGNTRDAIVGTLVNPMTQNYKGEDFEKFMIHYYKALNYIYLNNTEEAIVEARRISLQTQAQADKYNDKANRYSQDAFSLMLQGLIYERDRDVNNAFIAYRNAVEVYLKQKDTIYYDTPIPTGLKYDVMRMAYLNGFESELQRFEKIFNMPYKHYQAGAGGELVLFWENGLAPIKQQEDLVFSLVKGSNGDFVFTNAAGTILIPIDHDVYRNNSTSLNDVHSVRVAFPKYVSKPAYFTDASINVDSNHFYFEKAEDINALAVETLKQRFGKEMGKTLTRLAIKKGAEYALKESAKGSGKNGKDNALLEGLGFGVQLYSLLSEKADTRNWQSLPNQILYTRVPLKLGENKIALQLKSKDGNSHTDTLTVKGNGNLQFLSYPTLR